MELRTEASSTFVPKAEGPLAGRPVDLVHLARYTLGDVSYERQVLAVFRTQSGACLNKLAHAEHEKAWRDAAHTIADSARDIGAWQVARTAQDAEALAGAALEGARVEALESLQRDLSEANGYIRTLLADG